MTNTRPKPVSEKKTEMMTINKLLPLHCIDIPILAARLYDLCAFTPQPTIKGIYKERSVRYYEYLPPTQDIETKESKIEINKKAASLASILVISRFLGQINLESRCCYYNRKTNSYENWNHDMVLDWWESASLVELPIFKLLNTKITPEGLQNLLYDEKLLCLDWLGVKYMLKASQTFKTQANPELSELSKDPDFDSVTFLTIFKLITIPKEFFLAETKKLDLFHKLMSKQTQFENAAFQISAFRAFLYNSPEKNVFFQRYLTKFEPKYQALILKKIKELSSPQALEDFILKKEMSVSTKKHLLKEVVIERIRLQQDIKAVKDIIEDLATNENYQVLRDRHKYEGWSLFGYNYKGMPVSATFSEIDGAARKHILELAKKQKIENIEKDLDVVFSHRTTGWFELPPVLSFLGVPTRSATALAAEKDWQEEFVIVDKQQSLGVEIKSP